MLPDQNLKLLIVISGTDLSYSVGLAHCLQKEPGSKYVVDCRTIKCPETMKEWRTCLNTLKSLIKSKPISAVSTVTTVLKEDSLLGSKLLRYLQEEGNYSSKSLEHKIIPLLPNGRSLLPVHRRSIGISGTPYYLHAVQTWYLKE